MNPPIKLLLAFLAAGSVTSLAFFGWSAKAKDAAFHLSNGIDVTPVEVVPDDMTELLDAKIWKFDVLLPHPEKGDYLSVKLYQHGKVVTEFAGGGFGPSPIPKQHFLLTFGIIPIAGDFSTAKQIKWMLKQDGGSSNGISANPFRESKELNWSIRSSEHDDSVDLMGGRGLSQRDPSDFNTSIALNIKNDMKP